MPRLIVDGMNVIGSRPTGWWRDRPAAARRLIAQLQALALIADSEAVSAEHRNSEAVSAEHRNSEAVSAEHRNSEAVSAEHRNSEAVSAEQQISHLTVVLDGRPLPDLPEGEHDGVTVRYATRRGRNSADDRIIDLVAADPDPSSLTVVTSDRALRDRALALRAQVVGAGTLLRRLDALDDDSEN